MLIKSEIRNTKSETNSKHENENSKPRLVPFSNFGFRICFEFRYSYFGFLGIALIAWLFCSLPAARADFDPGLNQPYHLQIVLHIADNRFLTPIFQEQVQRELRDHLQLAYGPLAKVEVVRQHPLLREVRARGLQQALDGWKELSGRKTHFLLIDFVDGRYEMQARQHDGFTGLNSPVVRRDRLRDRRLVAQRAARLVDKDFGLAGTVVDVGKDEVKLAIRGGGLGVSLDRWLKPGDVFAISRIRQQGDKQRAQRLEWAVLQTIDEPRQGLCRCRYFHRYVEDRLSVPSAALGYRCLKLTTVAAPVRLRLIDEKSLEPQAGVQVHVFKENFAAKPRELTTNQEGLAITMETFSHLVLVKVLGGGGIRAQFPIEIVAERTVVCLLSGAVSGQTLEALEARKDLWLGRLYDNLNLAGERVAELNALLAKSLDSALAGARGGLKDLDEELAALTLERNQLVRQAKEKKLTLDLGDGPRLLEDLRGRHRELADFSKRLEKAIAKSAETQALIQILERAWLREAEANFDQAIALYEKIVETNKDQKKVLGHLEDLKKAWAVKSPDHAKAREFLMQVWPRLDVAALKANLPKAEKAFVLCRQNQDRLTPRKLLLANQIHAANLKKRLDVLKRQGTPDSRTEAKAIAAVAEGIRKLHAEASAFVAEKNSTKGSK
jgi:tetratricopeptide (TPR) repeat protein